MHTDDCGVQTGREKEGDLGGGGGGVKSPLHFCILLPFVLY
jgi:hypothetical protein